MRPPPAPRASSGTHRARRSPHASRLPLHLVRPRGHYRGRSRLARGPSPPPGSLAPGTRVHGAERHVSHVADTPRAAIAGVLLPCPAPPRGGTCAASPFAVSLWNCSGVPKEARGDAAPGRAGVPAAPPMPRGPRATRRPESCGPGRACVALTLRLARVHMPVGSATPGPRLEDAAHAPGSPVHSCGLHVDKQVGRKFVLSPGLCPAGSRGRSPVTWPEHLT